jgi:hypothetical protein
LAHGKSPTWYLDEDIDEHSGPSKDSFIYWYMPTKHGTVEELSPDQWCTTL